MRKALLSLLLIILMVQLANAAQVCVVVDYGKDAESEPDSKCIDTDEGMDGYTLMEKTAWSLLWSPQSVYGHMVCKINDVGTEVSGQYCEYSGEFWNIVLSRGGEWIHLPIGLDASGGCWNYDISSWNGHYCTKDGDVLGFKFGSEGSEPKMFTANISTVYVDGIKNIKASAGRGKIEGVLPGSTITLKIGLENLYRGSTDISIGDVSITGTLEEISNDEDMIEEINEFELKAGNKVNQDMEFNIPLQVEAKDRFLKVEIEAKDDAGIKYDYTFGYSVNIGKEEHQLRITQAQLDQPSYKCGGNAVLSLSILNIGSNSEDAQLEIKNKELNLDIINDIKLSADVYGSSNKYEGIFNVGIPDNAGNGAYPITVTASYGAEKEMANASIVVSGCDEKKTSGTNTQESKESQETENIGAGAIIETEETTAEGTSKTSGVKSTAKATGFSMPVVLTVSLIILCSIIAMLFAAFLILRK